MVCAGLGERPFFMRKRLPPLNPLRAFEATARHLSVSRAAKELNVTPGAVSHQVRALEEALRVKLFRRTAGHLQLSSYGSAYQPAIAAAFDSIAEASALLTRQKTEGDLVVSCVQALASFWLIPRLGTFAERYPDIRLKLVAAEEADPTDVDVAIRYGAGPWPGFHAQLWSHMELFPVCSPTLVNQKPLRSVADLAAHTLLHGDEDGNEWQMWLSAARAPTMVGARYLKLSNWHLAIEAAIYGHGITLGDSITASSLLAEGKLVMPFGITVPASGAFYIVCRNELRNAATLRAFTDWLNSELVPEKRIAPPAKKGRAKSKSAE
jgi:LysR family transcriptional regulator, glycine cleavage system transcriptional activator